MTDRERSGSERIAFRDAVTGRTIWQLTDSQMEDKHTYYDISPWSTDQRYVAFSSGDPHYLSIQHRDNLAACGGEIFVMDTEDDYAISRVAGDAFFTTHSGAHAMWHPTALKLYYWYRAPDRIGVVDLETGEFAREMSGGIRQMSPDGKAFAWNCNDPEYGEGRGIYLMAEDGSDVRRIVSTEALYALTPNRDAFDVADMWVQNTKWRHDSAYIMLASRTPKGAVNNYYKHIYIVSRDGSEVWWVTDYGHHHSWTPDGTQVLYCDWKQRERFEGFPREEPRLYLIDADGSNRRMVLDEPVAGHPLMDPTGTRIVTWDRKGVILVWVDRQEVAYLATFGEGFEMSHRGTHPHAVWSPDGTQILYNSAQTGHSQIYMIPEIE